MDEILKKVIKDAIKNKEKLLRDAEMWLEQDMESLKTLRGVIVEKNANISKLKIEIDALQKTLR